MQTTVSHDPTPGRSALRWTPIGLASAFLVVAAMVGVGVGTVPIGPLEIVRAIWNGATGAEATTADTIVWHIRLPRVLLAGTVGASLALAGVAYQGIFRNPLADPYLLGVASGASLGAAAAIVLGGSIPLLATAGVPIASFLAALATVAAVILLARRNGRLPMLSLILAGVVMGSLCSAGTSFLMLVAQERAAGVLAWLLGSFGLASWTKVLLVLPIAAVAAALFMASARALDLLQLGDDPARQLGLPVEGIKIGLIVLATLVTAAAVSVSGAIGFVGLLVPHAVRLMTGPEHRMLTPLAGLLGASFLILADLFARTVVSPAEIPIGIITALVGGPFFLYLLRRQQA